MKTMRNCSSSSSYIFVISTPVRREKLFCLQLVMNPVPHFEIKVKKCKNILNIFIETY